MRPTKPITLIRTFSVALFSFIIGGLVNSAHSGPLCCLRTGSSTVNSATTNAPWATEKPWSGLKGMRTLSLEISGGGSATDELREGIESLLGKHGLQVVPAEQSAQRAVDELRVSLNRTGCKAVIARSDESLRSAQRLPVWFASLSLNKTVTMDGDEQQICQHVLTERVAHQLLADLSRANRDALLTRPAAPGR